MAYLITRPEHDDTTHYLSNWSRKTISTAEQRGISVIDLHQEKANRHEVESRLRQASVSLVMFNGHGSPETVTGHKNAPLVSAGTNEALLKSKVVYALSCSSAKILGVKSVEAGAKSYTGFDDDFVFSYTQSMLSRPALDETAKLFLEPSNLFVETLLKKNTVEEARKRAVERMKNNLLILLKSKDSTLARYLWWDIRHFVSHGDLKATV